MRAISQEIPQPSGKTSQFLIIFYHFQMFAKIIFHRIGPQHSSDVVTSIFHQSWSIFVIPPAQRSCWGGILVSLRPSVCPSVHPKVRPASVPHPSRIPCPLCSFYSSGWIHFIFMHLIKQLQRVCRVQSCLQNFKIWNFGNFLKLVTLTSFCFDLESDVNH